MEDSVVQQHIKIEEQLNKKNQEIIGQNRKERKKKELEEYFDKNRNEKVVGLLKILKKQ